MDEFTEKLIETTIKETVRPIYEDALSPSLKELGKIGVDIAKTARLVTLPIQYAAYLQDRLKKHLEKALKNIPKENLVKPHDSISVPILEQLKNYEYNSNYSEEVLANMYQKLLSKACNKKTTSIVHPRFVKIISDMSPDEAKIFNFVGQNTKFSASHFENFVSYLEKKENVGNTKYIKMYLSNLESLGLLNITKEEWGNKKPDPAVYILDENTYYNLTEFGMLLYQIVRQE